MHFGLIYLVTNSANGKRYVGQTVGRLSDRWRKHQAADSRCPALSAAICRHGVASFTIAEIARADSKEELNALEDHFVSTLNTMAPHGYNIKAGGGSKGKWSDEKRRELARKSLEGKTSPQGRENARQGQLARWQSEEERAKHSEILKAACSEPAVRRTKSAAMAAVWADPARREAMIAAQTAPTRKPRSPDHSAKLWESRRRRAAAKIASDGTDSA